MIDEEEDRARKENNGRQVRPNAPDANCEKNPEAGCTLGGTGSRLSRHTAGILAED